MNAIILVLIIATGRRPTAEILVAAFHVTVRKATNLFRVLSIRVKVGGEKLN